VHETGPTIMIFKNLFLYSLAFIAFLFVPALSWALTVNDTGTSVELSTPELTVIVGKSLFKITIENSTGTKLLEEAAGPSEASLAYKRGSSEYRLVQVESYLQSGNQVAFTCTTTEGADAVVTIEFLDNGSFFIEFSPPTPATVTRVSETLIAQNNERYYGLIERIISDGAKGNDSELRPKEVGSLDLRGETVDMWVDDTISIYTPFFHSSRGYGLFVDGSMPGIFDLAKTRNA